MNELRNCIKEYRDVDNELRVLNKTVSEKRESRREIEVQLCSLVKHPQFDGVNKVNLDDGSYIKIQRPETYSKGWSLSKKDLGAILQTYFQTSRNPNADDCLKFIVEQRKQESIGKDFEISRIVPE